MTDFLGVKVNEHGVPIWVPGDRTAQLVFYRLFFETTVGQQLSPFLSADTDVRMMARILQIHRKWYRDAEVTLDSFTRVVESLLATRDPELIGDTPDVVEQEPEDTTPRDKNGKPLTPSQLAWREHGEFANTHSVKACRTRAQTDSSFKRFMETSYRLEMQKEIDGVGVDLNARPASPTEAPPQLREFAATYLRTAVDEVRKLMSPAINPAGHSEYRKNVDAAIKAGLL